MPPSPDQTALLLKQWREGNQASLEQLLDRHLTWIQMQVRRRLGPKLRSKADTADFVQDAVVQLLRYGPKFQVNGEVRFRALMARIVENTLRNKHDWYTAKRRDQARERPLPADSVLDLDNQARPAETPSRIVARNEHEAWIRMGIELLGSQDREAVILRDWDELSFSRIGAQLGISDDAARKRYARAVSRLAILVGALRRGEIDALLAEDVVDEDGRLADHDRGPA